jgi:hypothetical protein
MYSNFTGSSRAIYRKDFSAIARPAYRQFNCDYYWRRGYLEGLGNQLKGEQSLAESLGEPWDISCAQAAAETFTAGLTEAKREYDAHTPEEIAADLGRHKQPKGSPGFLAMLGKLEHSIALLPSWPVPPETDADRAEQAKHDAVWVAYLKRQGRNDEIVAFERQEPKAEQRAPKPLPSYLDGVTVGRRADWTDVGGVLGQMRDHILATAPYPNRRLAVMAALATLSAACGRRIYAPTGLNLALYLAMIAKTGAGKDAPLRAVPKFLHASGLGLMAQPGKTFTVSGFEQCLIDSRGACVATCDEIGDNLLRKILSKKAMSYEIAVKTFLMELSGLQDDSPPFALTKRAANGADKDKVHTVHSVPGASFTLIGASTPAAFYEALSMGAIGDGSLNRFMIIDADPTPDDENIVDDVVPVPQSIIDALSDIATCGAVAGVIDMTGGHTWPKVESQRIAFGAGAKERYKLLGKQVRAVVRDDVPFAALYARVAANALKVATLLALARAVDVQEPPAVSVDDIDAGAAMALEAAQTAADGAAKNISGSEFEANCKALLAVVDAAGDKGLSESTMHRKPGRPRLKRESSKRR